MKLTEKDMDYIGKALLVLCSIVAMIVYLNNQ